MGIGSSPEGLGEKAPGSGCKQPILEDLETLSSSLAGGRFRLPLHLKSNDFT